jgi:hypothetical protein
MKKRCWGRVSSLSSHISARGTGVNVAHSPLSTHSARIFLKTDRQLSLEMSSCPKKCHKKCRPKSTVRMTGGILRREESFMYQVVLDTNALVAALRSKLGASHQILKRMGDAHWRALMSRLRSCWSMNQV